MALKMRPRGTSVGDHSTQRFLCGVSPREHCTASPPIHMYATRSLCASHGFVSLGLAVGRSDEMPGRARGQSPSASTRGRSHTVQRETHSWRTLNRAAAAGPHVHGRSPSNSVTPRADASPWMIVGQLASRRCMRASRARCGREERASAFVGRHSSRVLLPRRGECGADTVHRAGGGAGVHGRW